MTASSCAEIDRMQVATAVPCWSSLPGRFAGEVQRVSLIVPCDFWSVGSERQRLMHMYRRHSRLAEPRGKIYQRQKPGITRNDVNTEWFSPLPFSSPLVTCKHFGHLYIQNKSYQSVCFQDCRFYAPFLPSALPRLPSPPPSPLPSLPRPTPSLPYPPPLSWALEGC